ncbi:unnamed protein product [Amoebophrya sp. A120]|nr:unnamed protein product [Amoebophrya sp. A120]|eukprot:GSA120T00019171001.1
MPKEVNMVNEMKLWKDRVDGELNSAAEWEANWGFLKAEKKVEAPPEGKFSVERPPAPASPKPSVTGEDAVELTAKLRYTINRGKTPKEIQARPLTTSQELGWRPPIELFGRGDNGVKRDPGIWPQ